MYIKYISPGVKKLVMKHLRRKYFNVQLLIFGYYSLLCTSIGYVTYVPSKAYHKCTRECNNLTCPYHSSIQQAEAW